jgi:hypothetical protein
MLNHQKKKKKEINLVIENFLKNMHLLYFFTELSKMMSEGLTQVPYNLNGHWIMLNLKKTNFPWCNNEVNYFQTVLNNPQNSRYLGKLLRDLSPKNLVIAEKANDFTINISPYDGNQKIEIDMEIPFRFTPYFDSDDDWDEIKRIQYTYGEDIQVMLLTKLPSDVVNIILSYHVFVELDIIIQNYTKKDAHYCLQDVVRSQLGALNPQVSIIRRLSRFFLGKKV